MAKLHEARHTTVRHSFVVEVAIPGQQLIQKSLSGKASFKARNRISMISLNVSKERQRLQEKVGVHDKQPRRWPKTTLQPRKNLTKL